MKVLDVRGETCPMPVLRTKKALEELEEGEILEVVLDYPPAEENVKRFVESQGHEIVQVEGGSGVTRIRVRKAKGRR